MTPMTPMIIMSFLSFALLAPLIAAVLATALAARPGVPFGSGMASVGAAVGARPLPGSDVGAGPRAIRDLARDLTDVIRRGLVLLAAMTDYLEGQVIAHIFRTASFTKPTVLAAALYTATPGETGGGTEVSGGSYGRVALNPLDANWAAPSSGNGTTSNLSALTFPAPTANWGVITSTAILDATTTGNMLFYGALTTSKTVNNGDAAPSFAIGALSVALD